MADSWPLLMDVETASRYLSITEDQLHKLALAPGFPTEYLIVHEEYRYYRPEFDEYFRRNFVLAPEEKRLELDRQAALEALDRLAPKKRPRR